MKAHRVSRAYKEYRKWPQVWNASIQYCFEYSKLCKELSNFGLQDAQNASSANCFALRDAHCGKPSTQEESAALKIFTLPSLPKTLPKHIPSSCFLCMHWGHWGLPVLSKQELETTRECRELRSCSQHGFHR